MKKQKKDNTITAERLKKALDLADLSQQELADKSGVAKASISQYINKLYAPSNINAGKMGAVLHVSPVWLMGYNVPMEEKKSEDNTIQAIRIPVYGRVAAGIPMEAITDITDWEEIPASWQGEYISLQVKGDSMLPKMSNGDVVIVRLQEDTESGDFVVAQINNEDATVKKLLKRQDGITLQPLNPNYEPLFFSEAEKDKVKIIGKVVEIRVKL